MCTTTLKIRNGGFFMSKIEDNNEPQYIEIDSFFEDDEKDLEIKEETKSKKKT